MTLQQGLDHYTHDTRQISGSKRDTGYIQTKEFYALALLALRDQGILDQGIRRPLFKNKIKGILDQVILRGGGVESATTLYLIFLLY